MDQIIEKCKICVENKVPHTSTMLRALTMTCYLGELLFLLKGIGHPIPPHLYITSLYACVENHPIPFRINSPPIPDSCYVGSAGWNTGDEAIVLDTSPGMLFLF